MFWWRNTENTQLVWSWLLVIANWSQLVMWLVALQQTQQVWFHGGLAKRFYALQKKIVTEIRFYGKDWFDFIHGYVKMTASSVWLGRMHLQPILEFCKYETISKELLLFSRKFIKTNHWKVLHKRIKKENLLIFPSFVLFFQLTDWQGKSLADCSV